MNKNNNNVISTTVKPIPFVYIRVYYFGQNSFSTLKYFQRLKELNVITKNEQILEKSGKGALLWKKTFLFFCPLCHSLPFCFILGPCLESQPAD